LLRIKGKPLTTDTSIVLAAVTDGFSRPNILDLKLGSRLWANDAPPAKRQRLERVSRETTSSSLGFRIAGMRIWQGERQQPANLALSGNASDTVVEVEEPVSSGSSAMPTVRITNSTTGAAHEDRHFEPETGYLFYNKLYGRTRTTADIKAAFREYFIVPSSGVDAKQALEVIRQCKEDVQDMQTVLEHVETRMFSSSILIVYEGDPEAWWEAMEWRRKARQKNEAENGNRAKTESNLTETEELDGDTDDDEETNTHAVKLIDFAHAEFVPGDGPDENVLHGVRSTVWLLGELEAELKAELET
jgi:1D-myo-inositol-tetrakisphosphate 5-kinase/inositol-polyphosphate multikinase